MTSSSRTPAPRPLNVPAPEGSRQGSYSRIIPAEELSGFAAWQPRPLGAGAPKASAPSAKARLAERPPASAGEGSGQGGLRLPSALRPPAPPSPTEADWRARMAQARKAGYEEGYRDGLKALEDFKRSHAQQVQAEAGAQLAALVRSFEDQWAALEPQMAQALSETAVRLARRVLRDELHIHPEHVVTVAQQAMQALLASARRVELVVHPDDLPLVRAGLGETLESRGSRLRGDASLARGGCHLHADIAHVDGTLERRWAEATASLGHELPWQAEAPPASAESPPDAPAKTPVDSGTRPDVSAADGQNP
jgi:flagellar assembly protein FliH